MAEYYMWFKSFHIIGVVVWMAGLFYLPRLFIYHVEANEHSEPTRSILKKQFQIMEKRLLNIITTPGMVVTVVMAVGLVVSQPEWMRDGWLHIKLSLVALLIGYHFYCVYLMNQLHAERCRWTPKQLRAFNEAPTILLVAIVLLVVFKNDLPTSATAWIIFGMVLLFAVTIQLYARKRRLDKEKLVAAESSQE